MILEKLKVSFVINASLKPERLLNFKPCLNRSEKWYNSFHLQKVFSQPQRLDFSHRFGAQPHLLRADSFIKGFL
jgi:hypothetical protein